MKYEPLGTSGVAASRVALGVMRINEKRQDDADKIVKTVLDNGVNFFDTADCYSSGESSRRFGQALVDLGVKRDEIFV